VDFKTWLTGVVKAAYAQNIDTEQLRCPEHVWVYVHKLGLTPEQALESRLKRLGK
jgi:hypothetical protein